MSAKSLSALEPPAKSRLAWEPAKPPAFPPVEECLAKLPADETVVGWKNGRPLVRRPDGTPGMVFGVTYLIDAPAYDDREAFDPAGHGHH